MRETTLPKFKVTCTAVADLTTEVDADSEGAAVDAAYEMARQFANHVHRRGDYRYTVSINDEWNLRDLKVREL